MIPDILMHRFEFQMRFAKGDVLDMGCADSAQWKYPIPQDSMINPQHIKSVTLADCDEWNNDVGFKFIRCFAERVPMPNKSFDTVIYGDILEHVKDCDIVLQEGKRLTRDRILISVPNEYKWQNRPEIMKFETREKHIERGRDLRELGFQQSIGHPSKLCTAAVDDTIFPHIHHVRFFDETSFEKLIKDNFNTDEWQYHLYNLHYSPLNFVSLAAIIFRKDIK